MDDEDDPVVLASTESPRLHHFGPGSTASLRFRNSLVTSTSFTLKSARARVAQSANSTDDAVDDDAKNLRHWRETFFHFQKAVAEFSAQQISPSTQTCYPPLINYHAQLAFLSVRPLPSTFCWHQAPNWEAAAQAHSVESILHKVMYNNFRHVRGIFGA